jgi:hypothetical protein
MAVMIYALYTYHWRAISIRKGGRGPYDDRLGPVGSNDIAVSYSPYLNASNLDPALHCPTWYA